MNRWAHSQSKYGESMNLWSGDEYVMEGNPSRIQTRTQSDIRTRTQSETVPEHEPRPELEPEPEPEPEPDS